MKVVMLGNDSKEEIEKRVQIVASAGNLSRANAKVTEVIENNSNYESNLKLARAVVGYGHKSIAEHDYLTFAIEDVTPIVEQILISYRLTSFTIKSRRNVDFRNVGFYVPDFKNNEGEVLENNGELQDSYKKYMQSLFDKYGSLVDMELPIEDCRYILPYSYYSNIIMGCDANELLRITSDMLYGKNSNITEVHELGEKFAEIIREKIPYLSRALDKEEGKEYYKDQFEYLDSLVDIKESKLVDSVKMINYTENADDIVLRNIIMSRYQFDSLKAEKILKELDEEHQIKDKLMESLINTKNKRELEQVSYSFEAPISLAVLTHITRHRMHSLLIPDFAPLWNLDNFIIPDSLKENYEDFYKNVYEENKGMVKQFRDSGVRDEDLVYFYLSGNACNIYTTINARTLEWISRMRSCFKAQWEIRNIVNKMIEEVKEVSPYIHRLLGPTCKIEGYCPEGKDSCKNRGVVIIKK